MTSPARSRPTEWLIPGARVLLLAPHPDDETIAAGGMLQRAVAVGCAIKIVFVTDGDNNPWPQRVVERRWFLGSQSRARLGARRRAEALNALRILGVAEHRIEFWSYPDQGLTSLLRDEQNELLRQIIALLQRYQPAVVFAPSRFDLHPDHNAVGLLVRLALAQLSGPVPACFHYVVHGRGVLVRAADFFVFSECPLLHKIKRMALAEHRSQLALGRRRTMAHADRREYFIRDDRGAVDEAWLHPGNRKNYITAPRIGFLPGMHVQLLDARSRWSQRRINVGLRKSTVHGVASGQRSRLTVSVDDHDDVRWLKQDTLWGFRDRSGWLRVVTAPQASASRRHVCCVIPCYNVARFCGAVVIEAAGYADSVIAIDDGSTDRTREILEGLAERHANVQVLVHPCNRGKGVALLAAFAYALAEIDFDVLVTLDADGQHRACDILPLVQALRAGTAVLAIGLRDRFAAMPLRSRIGNEFMGKIIHWAFPTAPEDTQSGFRAHTRKFVVHIVENMKGRRYETELQILVAALAQGPVATITIPTIYQDNNRSSHFQPLRDSLRVLGTLGKLCLSDRTARRI